MPHDLTKISTASDNAHADLIKSFLEEHGIFTYIQGYHHRSMLGFAGPHIELNIMVRKDQADAATKLLQELNEEIKQEPPSEVPTQREHVSQFRPRSAMVACCLPFICPGLGNFYAGRKDIGGWILVATAVCYISLFIFMHRYDSNVVSTLLVLIVGLIFLDAFTAVRFIKSRER